MATDTVPQLVAANIERHRDGRGWSQAELVDRLAGYGVKWDRSTIAKIEACTRQVTVEELVALSWVFGVSPVALLAPKTLPQQVKVTPNTQTSGGPYWAWLEGAEPMGGGRVGELQSPEAVRSYFIAGPDEYAIAENDHPGLRMMRQSAWRAALAAAGRYVKPPRGAPAVDEASCDRLLAHWLEEVRETAGDELRRVKRRQKARGDDGTR